MKVICKGHKDCDDKNHCSHSKIHNLKHNCSMSEYNLKECNCSHIYLREKKLNKIKKISNCKKN